VEDAPPLLWPALAYAFTLVAGTWENRDAWFVLTPFQAARECISAPISGGRRIAEHVRTNSAPTDTVAVLGSEPEIYFLSHRHSATGYIYTYPLMELQPYAQGMQEQMIQEIEHARPCSSSPWIRKNRGSPTNTRRPPSSIGGRVPIRRTMT